MLEAVSAQDGATRVLDALHGELGIDVWLCDRSGALLAHAGRPPEGEPLSEDADRP